MSPLCQTHIAPEQLNRMEPFYPLHTWVCDRCFLVQLEEYVSPDEIFGEYAYFSSYSNSWVEHARSYCEMAVDRFGLDRNSWVAEIASNDGYLLQYFVQRDVPVLGIEPCGNVAKAAEKIGVPTLTEFFGTKLAAQLVTGAREDVPHVNRSAQPSRNEYIFRQRLQHLRVIGRSVLRLDAKRRLHAELLNERSSGVAGGRSHENISSDIRPIGKILG